MSLGQFSIRWPLKNCIYLQYLDGLLRNILEIFKIPSQHTKSNTTGHAMTLQSSFAYTNMATNSGLKHVDFEQLKKQFSHIGNILKYY